jgi:hypothetical protein
LIYPIKLIRETETFSLKQFLLKLEQLSVYSFFRLSSSHVGLDVGGLILKEEKVEQEVLGGPQAKSFDELNPEQGKPWCI